MFITLNHSFFALLLLIISVLTIQCVPAQDASTTMVFVEGGTFQMGCAIDGDEENPVHSVTVRDFYMCRYEVTQREYAAYCHLPDPCDSEKNPDCPVYYVSWYDAFVYCNRRSIAEGLTPCYCIKGTTDPADWGTIPAGRSSNWDTVLCDWTATGYRLPTEAE